MWLALGAASLGPWRLATVLSALGGLLALGANALDGQLGLSALTAPFTLALFLFFLVGGLGATQRPRGDGEAQRLLREWARTHPFKTALPPAVNLTVGVVGTQLLLGTDLPAALGTGFGLAALLTALVGGIGTLTRTSAGARR